MCRAAKIIEQQINSIEKELQLAWKDTSKCDTELSEFYHSVESRVFNAAEGYYIAKDLQNILRKRRKVKFEASQLKSLIDNLNNIKCKLDTNEKQYFKKADSNYKEYIS